MHIYAKQVKGGQNFDATVKNEEKVPAIKNDIDHIKHITNGLPVEFWGIR